MDAKDLAALIALTISLNGSLIQLLSPIRDAWRWRRKAHKEVGPLGAQYEVVITVPTVIWFIGLVTILLLSIIGLIAGTWIRLGGDPPCWMAWVFKNGLLLTVVYGVLLPIVHTRCVSHALLWAIGLGRLSKTGRSWRHTVGWANADWQLKHSEEFRAMTVDETICERFGHTVFRVLRAQSARETGTVYRPAVNDPDCLGNYLVVGFVVMIHVERVWPYDRGVLERCWHYLAWAQESVNMFCPEKLAKKEERPDGFYAALRALPDQPTATHLLPVHPLPDDQLIQRDVDAAVARLEGSFGNRATRLAVSHTDNQPKRATLVANLRGFPGLDSEAYQRLFLIMAAQFKIWATLDFGPFPYPYSTAIAQLLLNARCLRVPAATKVIEPDGNCENITTLAQQKVTEAVIALVRESSGSPATRQFVQTAFGRDVDAVTDWDLCDYVDQCLYNHVRRECRKREPGAGTRRPDCCMRAVDGARCACDAADAPWRVSDAGILVRG